MMCPHMASGIHAYDGQEVTECLLCRLTWPRITLPVVLPDVEIHGIPVGNREGDGTHLRYPTGFLNPNLPLPFTEIILSHDFGYSSELPIYDLPSNSGFTKISQFHVIWFFMHVVYAVRSEVKFLRAIWRFLSGAISRYHLRV